MQPLVVLKITSPAAGELIALRCAFVILGGRKPRETELMSSLAEGSGVVVPMPTCASVASWKQKTRKARAKKDFIFRFCGDRSENRIPEK
jgi:hypothetical protein